VPRRSGVTGRRWPGETMWNSWDAMAGILMMSNGV
jgi:hypothetical protein